MQKQTYKSILSCAVLGLLGFTTACGQTSSVTDCGEGDTVLVGNERYCVYRQELIIEGFDCPPQMSFHEVPGGAVCSPKGPGEPLPEQVQEPFGPVMEPDPGICANPPCEVMMPLDMGGPEVFVDAGLDMGGGVEGVEPRLDMDLLPFEQPTRESDPALFGQPVPLSDTMFRRVARSEKMACLITDADVMSCWGAWRNDERSGLITDVFNDLLVGVRGRSQVVVGQDRLCAASTEQPGTECLRFDDQGAGLWVLAEGVLPGDVELTMHHKSGRLGTLCGLDESSGELSCIAMTEEDEVLRALTRMEFLSMVRFKQFSVEQVQTSGAEIFACGITTQDAVICASTPTQGQMSQAESRSDHTYTEVFVGERDGETVVTARRATGEVDVWRGRLDFEPLPGPTGTFVELYSAFCGLQNDQVVCWDDVAAPGRMGPPTLSVLYPQHPRHFDIALDATDGGVHWCAISLDGELTCSAF